MCHHYGYRKMAEERARRLRQKEEVGRREERAAKTEKESRKNRERELARA